MNKDNDTYVYLGIQDGNRIPRMRVGKDVERSIAGNKHGAIVKVMWRKCKDGLIRIAIGSCKDGIKMSTYRQSGKFCYMFLHCIKDAFADMQPQTRKYFELDKKHSYGGITILKEVCV